MAHTTTTHQTTVKAATVAMMVVEMTTAIERTTAATPGTTTAETTAIIAVITTITGLIRMATEIAMMAITISSITSKDAIYAIASTKEPMIVHPMKAIAVWNMILPTARWV